MGALITRRNILLGAAVALAATAITVAAASGDAASETQVHTVSALDRLPAAVDLTPAAHEWATRLATRGHVGEPVRRLRAAVGQSQTDIYGFRQRDGGVCFLYVGFAGNCSNAEHFRKTGVQWLIGAGSLVALVADDVNAVTLTVDGKSYDVSLANNIGYADYETGDEAKITVIYASGKAETSTIRLKGPPPASPAE